MYGRSKAQRRADALALVAQASQLQDNYEMRELLDGYALDCKRTRNGDGDYVLARRLRSVVAAYDERPWKLTQPARFALLTGEAIGLLA